MSAGSGCRRMCWGWLRGLRIVGIKNLIELMFRTDGDGDSITDEREDKMLCARSW